MKKISPRIAAISAEMKRNDIKVPDLAPKLNMALSTLYRLLEGESDPSLSTVDILERKLGIRYERVKS